MVRREWVLAIGLGFILCFSGVAAGDYHDPSEYDDEEDWDGDQTFTPDDSFEHDDEEETEWTPDGSDTTLTESFSGVAIPMQDAFEAELSTAIEQAKANYPGGDPAVWIFMNGEMTAVVASETPVSVGEVEVEGVQADGGEVSAIVADSVNLDTEPERVDSEALSESPTDYQYQYIESTAQVKHVPFAFETADGQVMQVATSGGFATQTAVAQMGPMVPPTRLTNNVAVNASRIIDGGARGYELGEYRVSGNLFLDSHRQDVWVADSDATVTGVILTRSVGAPVRTESDGEELNRIYTDDVQAQSETEAPFSDVVERADSETGFTVETEVNLVGSSISVKETLVQASACDGSETVGSAPNCVPAVTDMTVVTGVAATGGGNYDALPFLTTTNNLQSNAVEPVAGRYRITGEIVSADEMHPGFQGEAILIYELERVGSVSLESDNEQLTTSDADRVAGEIREQLEVSPSEYEDYASSKQSVQPISETEAETSEETESDEAVEGQVREATADATGFTPTVAILSLISVVLYLRRRG